MEAPDEGEDILEDFSDGLEALTAVPVWFLSTWDEMIQLLSYNCLLGLISLGREGNIRGNILHPIHCQSWGRMFMGQLEDQMI